MSKYTRENTVVLFDVDGTLTKSRLKIEADMLKILLELREIVTTGFVGGSDLKKQREQIGDNCIDLFDYCFPQNGVNAYHNGKLISSSSFLKKLGEKNNSELINFMLKYLSEIDLPQKRGCFIEFRESMLNVSPIGRNCSQKEREDFYELDKKLKIREKFCKVLEEKFAEKFDLKFSIGGQISFDIFPKGWDKTYCLKFFEKMNPEYIFFFGDKTMEGGNDREIFLHEKTVGKTVTCPADTIKFLKEMFF